MMLYVGNYNTTNKEGDGLASTSVLEWHALKRVTLNIHFSRLDFVLPYMNMHA